MIDRAYGIAVLIEPFTVFRCDLEIGLDDAHGGDSSEADDDLGADRKHLIAQITDTHIFLCGERIAVFRRTAFEDIGDVYVLAGDADGIEVFI